MPLEDSSTAWVAGFFEANCDVEAPKLVDPLGRGYPSTWSCHVSESFCAMVRTDLFVAHIVGPNKLQVYLTFVGFLKYSIEIKDPYSLRCLDSIDSWKPSPAPSSNIFRSTKSGLYQSLLSIPRTGWIPVQWNCNLIATTFRNHFPVNWCTQKNWQP